MKKYFILFSLISAILISAGCTHLVKKQISKTEDKTYYFTEFNYTHLSSTEEDVYSFFKNFPAKKIMFLIAKENNIIIDISEFQKFTTEGDPSNINVKKGFRKEFFSWNSQKKTKNKIIINYKIDYFEQKIPEVLISMIIDDKTYNLMNSEVENPDHLIKRITGYYPDVEKSAAEYDKLGYEKITPINGVIEYTKGTAVIPSENNEKATDKKAEIDNLMRNYVEGLDKDEKAKFRHEMLDLIYKLTE